VRGEESLFREVEVTGAAPPAVQLGVGLLRPPQRAGMLAAGEEILECRELEILAQTPVSVEQTIEQVRRVRS